MSETFDPSNLRGSDGCGKLIVFVLMTAIFLAAIVLALIEFL